MERDSLTQAVIGKAIEIHRALGPGLLESAYRNCLAYELTNNGFRVEAEKALPIIYKGLTLEHGYRVDLLEEGQIVVEIKHVEFLNELHTAQILTYMKFGKYKTGLLMNFNTKMMKDGIRRFIF